jgi:hypothetical protein
MIASLRRTLRAGQQEDDRKCEKDFGAAMNRKEKMNRKKNGNMLYQSLM